jgi:hypothetical protein
MQLCKECKEWNIDGTNDLCPKCQFLADAIKNNTEQVISALEILGYKVTREAK